MTNDQKIANMLRQVADLYESGRYYDASQKLVEVGVLLSRLNRIDPMESAHIGAKAIKAELDKEILS